MKSLKNLSLSSVFDSKTMKSLYTYINLVLLMSEPCAINSFDIDQHNPLAAISVHFSNVIQQPKKPF
ncbi:hypothetical protein P8452_65974 [Trifolium repens]|nr:hypothetical protein P8452_65974 [Trifolium repens]